MSATPRLSLPYIASQQAQKQVTYNAAMTLLDQLVQPAVKSRIVIVPPGDPAEGDTYIVPALATGDWIGKDGKFATWLSGAWSFVSPGNGWLAFVVDTAELAVFASGAWSSFVTNGGTALAKLGINAVADLTNRLAVGADASMFTHAGSSHRLNLNKASAADTASVVYANNFSGRAEIGLTGDDALHVKVSPNGSSWVEALSIAQSSGLLTLSSGQLAFPATQNPSANPNTLDDYEEGTWTPAINFGGAATGITYGAATLGRYTKIGRLVNATAVCTLTNKGSATGAAQLAGLPFATPNDPISGSVAIGLAVGFSSVTGTVMLLLQTNSTKLNFYHSNNGSAANLTNVNFGNATAVYLTVTYEAA